MLFGFSEEVVQYIEEHDIKFDIVPPSDRQAAFPHVTFSVKSIPEYLEVVELLHLVNNAPEDDLAFRGVSDHKYRLAPSLKVFQDRSDFGYDSDYNIEQKLVDEMITTHPEEFVGVSSDFDLLAKMQHLGLPTRLLDFSLNPLVALYFACQSLADTTARVICTRDTSGAYSRKTVEKVCGLYKVPEFAQFYLEDMMGGESGFLDYMIYTLEPLMAHPKCISERIKRQSGIFMIFPNVIKDRVWFNISSWGDGHYIFPYSSPEMTKYVKEIERRENPYEIYGIDPNQDLMGYQFVVTTDTYRKAKQYYLDKGEFAIQEGSKMHINPDAKWAFLKRFAINSDVAELSAEIMESCFCSILIDPQYKKDIMRALNHVNINEAFLFPEPEYTAKRIKNRYIK